VKNFKSHLNLKGPFISPPLVNPRFPGEWVHALRTPTGMVMPIDSPGSAVLGCAQPLSDHYSFIQASLSHLYDGDGESQNPWPSQLSAAATVPRHYLYFDTDNVEETSAITDSAIYASASDGTHLVKPSFAWEMHEVVLGKKQSSGYHLIEHLSHRRCTVWLWETHLPLA